ncbi:MAG TPA: alginate export family protein [Pseudobdellovibrionaceae bacterium]|nr:alginate export family protein [Pseudobdellovibrionaceae bacterium]
MMRIGRHLLTSAQITLSCLQRLGDLVLFGRRNWVSAMVGVSLAGIWLPQAHASESPAVAAVTSGASREIQMSGRARLRLEDLQSYSGTSFRRSQQWLIRVRPTLQMKVDEVASLVIEPQFAKVMGRDYSYTQTDSSGASAYNENLHMHQAFLRLNLMDDLAFKGGRFVLDYADGFVLSKADWGVFGRSFDGLQLQWKTQFSNVDLTQAKLDSTADFTARDKDLTVLYATLDVHENFKSFDLYALYEHNGLAGVNESRSAYGVRVKTQWDQIDFGFENANSRGTSGYGYSDRSTSFLNVTTGYQFSEIKMRLGLEYNHADKEWRDWYPLTKSPLGRNELIGRRNVQALALRSQYSASDALKLAFDIWNYQRVDDQVTAFTPSLGALGSVTSTDATANTALQIGQSVEFAATYMASAKVEYVAALSYFMQGAYLKNSVGDRNVTEGYLMATVAF